MGYLTLLNFLIIQIICNENRWLCNLLKLLIVDDEVLDREGLVEQIPWHDLHISEIQTAKNGFDALRKIKDFKPDILISDIKMPGLNGLELIKKVKIELPDIKVIFISGHDDFNFVQNALHLRAYNYILKPINTEELLNTMRIISKLCLDEIKEKYERNNLNFFLAKGKILQNDEICEKYFDYKKALYMDKELEKCLYSLDKVRLEKIVDEFFDDVYSFDTTDRRYIIMASLNIISKLEMILSDMDESISNILNTQINLWEKLLNYETITDIRNWIKHIFKIVIDYLKVKFESTNGKIIIQIEEFVKMNYDKDISLKEIANKFYYSPNHLGLIIKEMLGKGFTEYLTAYRMEMASDFLKNPSIKIYEVAQKVSYKNVNAFINKFKEHFGITPKEFKKRYEKC